MSDFTKLVQNSFHTSFVFEKKKARRVIFASLYKMIRVKMCETTGFEAGKSCPGFLYIDLIYQDRGNTGLYLPERTY